MEDKRNLLETFAQILVAERKEAVDGRAKSGIENEWRRCEEYYEGIDDMNRAETAVKGATLTSRMTFEESDSVASTRSTAFINITQPYVDMVASRIADLYLPTEDKPFAYDATPIADSPDDPTVMPDGKMTVGEAAKKYQAEQEEKADNAEELVWDWLCECRWHNEVRDLIDQGVKLGTSCLKGPYQVKRKKRKVIKDDVGNLTLKIEEENKPASKHVNIWNIYPDPACGESIHNGRYIFEKDLLSARKIRDLIDLPGYLKEEIFEVLREGPNKKYQDSSDNVKDNDMYEVWYYTGFASQEQLLAADVECKHDAPKLIPVSITMVNDRVVKAAIALFDSGQFPYDIFVYKRLKGKWYGLGVPNQVRTPQNMLISTVRNMLDNAGVGGGPQFMFRSGAVYPADGTWEITSRKIWMVSETADVKSVQDAIAVFNIPMVQVELMNIIDKALEFAERATSMPLILQGQQGSATETVGGMQILQSNSSSVVRKVAKNIDDDVTEPHLLRYYEWLMLYHDDSNAKGDFTVRALGSTVFYERDAQTQLMLQLLPMSSDPDYEISKAKIMAEVLKAQNISSERVKMTEDEIEQNKQNAQNQVDPRIEGQKQVAQIKVQGDLEKAKLVQNSDMAEIEAKNEAARTEIALKIQMQQEEHEQQRMLKQMEYDMKIMELAQSQQISVESIKAALARDAMKLKTQKELSALNGQAKQVSMPETEPTGLAEDGHAYEQ